MLLSILVIKRNIQLQINQIQVHSREYRSKRIPKVHENLKEID
jgi:phage-related protein